MARESDAGVGGSPALVASRTSSGRSASTIEVSNWPAWQAPLWNSSLSRRAHGQPGGAGACHRLGNDDVGLQRQVRAVGLDGPHRQDGDGSRAGGVPCLLPGHCGKRLHGYCVLIALFQLTPVAVILSEAKEPLF